MKKKRRAIERSCQQQTKLLISKVILFAQNLEIIATELEWLLIHDEISSLFIESEKKVFKQTRKSTDLQTFFMTR